MQVEEVGRTLDLSKVLDRIALVLTLARAYFLLIVMARSAPLLSQRPTLYSMIERGPKGQEKDRCTEALMSTCLSCKAFVRRLWLWLLHMWPLAI